VKRTLALAAVLLVAGCSNPPVSGKVSHKQHSDAYDYVTMSCVAYGKYGCNAWVPIYNHMPASWQVCVDGVDKDGKDASGCIEVGEYRYGMYAEGDHYPKGS
jgi:hypothetical protein